MRMTEITFAHATPIDGYGPGFFRVGGQVLAGTVCLTATQTHPWAGLEDVAPLLGLAGQIDVLIIGTGPEICHIPAALRAALEDAGVGVETMSSPSACRTFNVLLSEGRRVAAALLPV